MRPAGAVRGRRRPKRPLPLRSAAAVLLAAFGLFAFYQAEQARLPSLDPAETRRLLDEVQQRYGVKINVFAEGAQTGRRGLAEAPGVTPTAAEPPWASLALLGVHKSLQAYPPAVIRKFLQGIWIVGSLRIRDFPVGGTYIGPRIYLASDHLRTPAAAVHAERFFHHEFSSYLFLQPDFPEAAWLAAKPAGVNYLPDYASLLEATQKHAPASEAEGWWRQGFVSDYGRSSIENDVNTYAEPFMADPAELVRLAEAFPPVEAKARLLARYYARLNPDLRVRLARGPAAPRRRPVRKPGAPGGRCPLTESRSRREAVRKFNQRRIVQCRERSSLIPTSAWPAGRLGCPTSAAIARRTSPSAWACPASR